MAAYTKAKFLNTIGKETPVFVRLSTTLGGRGSADTVREARGFAVKFYTEDGNYDLLSVHIPIFFIRDPIKFPDLIHANKKSSHTGLADNNTPWDFFSYSPEALHAITAINSDVGIPDGYRHMDGFAVNSYKWVNDAGEEYLIKYHFKSK